MYFSIVLLQIKRYSLSFLITNFLYQIQVTLQWFMTIVSILEHYIVLIENLQSGGIDYFLD